jgi:predicted dehydrogenase
MGKHCFCQKPMTHSLSETRKMGDLAREKNLATQMGNQGTSNDGLRKCAAMIKAGQIGTVKEVHVWTNRPIWPQGGKRPDPEACPAHVKWDLWLGPAAYRPYAKGYHPFSWRGFWDFGTGALGDMACHTMNMPYSALDMRDPLSVQAETDGHDKDYYPKWSTIRYEFAERNGRPAFTMFWYDGGKLPDAKLLPEGKKLSESGSLLIGDAGKLYAPGDYAENGGELIDGHKKDVEFEKSPGHFVEFAEAVKGGPEAKSNFPNYATGLTETVLLGNLAVYSASAKGQGPKINSNAAKQTATIEATDLDGMIRHTYRAGYEL